MRRLLKDIAEHREVGDVTTLADSSVMDLIKTKEGGSVLRGVTATRHIWPPAAPGAPGRQMCRVGGLRGWRGSGRGGRG